jgi:cyclophilin family peptidyl-prolyl cis-trans isomerase
MTQAVLLLWAALAQAPSPDAAPSPSSSPSPTPTPSGPVVALDTSLGRITVALNQAKAPRSVANFLRYVRSGHYDGTIFHRVMPTFMIQGGGLDPSLEERPTGAPVRNEARNGLRNSRGSLALARTSSPDSATAQFFINVKDNHSLDFGISAGYAVFGEVLEGMDVVDKIAAVPTQSRGVHQNVPVTPVLIRKARVLSTGAEAGAPAPRPASPTPTPKPGVPE